ncbi:MAG: amidohydrolase family protein [Streptosporangiaceae bacterium]
MGSINRVAGSAVNPVIAPDLVVRGGRVVDPESGRDEIADVAIANGKVVAIGIAHAPGALELDGIGHVMTAGFIDLHSHVNGIAGLRLQALDGVTTALELEAGVTPVAAAGVPTFTHARDMIEMVPGARIDGAQEIVRAAGQTGARMHYCHLNSTSQRHVDRVLDLVGRAQRAGSRVTTEAYPYGSGMTGIGAAFLAPERLAERGMTPRSLTYVPTREQVASADRLSELRATDPGGLVIIRLLDEDDPADLRLLLSSLAFPGAMVASDAMPLTWSGRAPDPMSWPLRADAVTHPRTAGTFSHALRMLAHGDGPLGLTETLRRCSLLPAQLLQAHVPAMRRKGRLQPGCDADIVVFDPDTVTDQATYLASTRPSSGIRHVLVNGAPVVRNGELVLSALPGKPVRASAS